MEDLILQARVLFESGELTEDEYREYTDDTERND